MFTGIVKELGRVREVSDRGNTRRIAVETKEFSGSVNIGDSVAVNGVCLTATDKKGHLIYFDVLAETIKRTNLSRLKVEDAVNVEDSLRLGDHVGGHLVSGHIDCLGRIVSLGRPGDDVAVDIDIPQGYSEFVVEKGSIAIDGISLTVGSIKGNRIRLYVIPHTLKATTLGSKSIGETVNLEFDIIGKYVARAKRGDERPALSQEFLRAKGF